MHRININKSETRISLNKKSIPNLLHHIMFLRVLSNTIQLLIIFIFCLRIEYLNDKFGLIFFHNFSLHF